MKFQSGEMADCAVGQKFAEPSRRVPQFKTLRPVAHSAADMFDLVADVERYPEFVPLCESLKLIGRARDAAGHEVITARMTVAYKLLRESFTSRAVLDREAKVIRVAYLDGPFKRLENVWTFKPAGEGRCEVGFSIAYEFRSLILQTLMGAAFDKAFRKFSAAFEARADQVYGKRRIAQSEPSPAPDLPLKATPPAEAS
jgi:coenzyme Q-binding protein COQ10